jgi:hypothetical protein
VRPDWRGLCFPESRRDWILRVEQGGLIKFWLPLTVLCTLQIVHLIFRIVLKILPSYISFFFLLKLIK